MRRNLVIAALAVATLAVSAACTVTDQPTKAAPAHAQTQPAPPTVSFKPLPKYLAEKPPTAQAVAAADAAAVAAYTNSRCGNSSGRVLISIDDWSYGDPYRAVRIGAKLKALHIRAMFFLINSEARKYPDIVRTLRAQGHWVLNHTLSHITKPPFAQLSDAKVRSEIVNGVKSNRLRPPGGSYDAAVERIARSLGYRICTWTIDTRDWQYVSGKRRTATSIRAIVRNSLASAKRNGVILGHLFTNYEWALPGIIYDLHKQGYLFCYNRGAVGINMSYPAACT
jgi:peptidoglycan/xylan/chitin deacetylase (PgdA/CDA1 family)